VGNTLIILRIDSGKDNSLYPILQASQEEFQERKQAIIQSAQINNFPEHHTAK
jgi:hypothetical protein